MCAILATAHADEERLAARRQRGALRLLPELIAVGVVADASSLLGAIKSLVGRAGHSQLACSVKEDLFAAVHIIASVLFLSRTCVHTCVGSTGEGAGHH